MQEFRIFLDNIEFFDLPQELNKIEKTLIRDGGINNDEQIFRDKCEVDFTFIGDCYTYIKSKRCEDLCKTIKVRIDYYCNGEWNTFFTGYFNNKIAKHNINKCIITSKIYDNSYSAMIRERQDNEYALNEGITINGINIGACTNIIMPFFDEFGINYQKNIVVYDFFEVFSWLVNLLTDNNVQVISDYFIGVGYKKYSITTGAMLRLGTIGGVPSNTFDNTYLIPRVSYKKIFEEFRKILRLYTAIEYIGGNTYLRIEPENYFFNNNTILDIPNITSDLEEEFIINDLYSEIKVGSTNTKTETGQYYTPKIRLYAFDEETYNNCSNCELENTLDLINEWIIDSNLIHETLKGTDVWDKEIFIIELDGNNMPNKYQETNIAYDGILHYYYNDKLNNYNKLINWEGGIPNCIINFYNREPCMEAIYDNADSIIIQHESNYGNLGVTYTMLRFALENCDNIYTHNFEYNNQNCSVYDISAIPPYVTLWNNTPTGMASIYFTPFSGKYQFELQGNFTNILDAPGIGNIGPLEEYKWEMKLLIFQGGLIDLEGGGNIMPIEFIDGINFSGPNGFEDPHNVTFTITTPILTLNAGAIVVPVFRIKTIKIGINISLRDAVQFNSGYFKLLMADYDINNLPQSNIMPKQIKYSLNYPICYTDLSYIEDNKYGVIKLNGLNTWLKELKYKHNSISEIVLITDKIMC